MLSPKRSTEFFSRFSLFLLGYALLIILWGAWVRISGSGDGCGPHWPLCRGQIWIDQSFTAKAQTLIELTHRLKSGLFGLLVVLLVFIARASFAKGHLARKAAWFVLLLTIIESLLGAKLVLFGLVGTDDSVWRALSMSLHLANTLLLLFALTLCWQVKNLGNQSALPHRSLWVAHLCLLAIATTGAWAALSSTLFPTHSLAQGLAADFASDSHWLLRVRILHPILALALAIAVLVFIQRLKEKADSMMHKSMLRNAQYLIAFALLIGMSTLLMESPTLLKLLHLLSADLAWIGLSVLSLRWSNQKIVI